MSTVMYLHPGLRHYHVYCMSAGPRGGFDSFVFNTLQKAPRTVNSYEFLTSFNGPHIALLLLLGHIVVQKCYNH